jgi:CHASE2 domain-containing sensor protein
LTRVDSYEVGHLLQEIVGVRLDNESSRNFGKSIIVGLLILVLFFFLKWVNFEPVKYLVFLDTLLSNHIFEPLKPTDPNTRPVLFVDFDQQSMNENGYPLGSKTPRVLVARVLRTVRDAGASVIFLDLDLRDVSSEDQDLYNELIRPNRPPVIIPNKIFLSSKSNEEFRMLPNIFDGVINDTVVYRAHAEIVNRYGQAHGVYNVFSLKPYESKPCFAASLLTIKLANSNGSFKRGSYSFWDEDIKKLFLLQFRVDNNTKRWPASGTTYYYRISALNVLMKDTDLSCMKKGIVVIGASHLGADDFMRTVLGDMPGALVHSNMVLQLQTEPINDHPTRNQWIKNLGLDIVIIIINSALYVAILLNFKDGLNKKINKFFSKPKTEKELKIRNLYSETMNTLLHVIFYLMVPFWPLLLFYICLPNSLEYQQSRQYAILMAICVTGIEVVHMFLNFIENKIIHKQIKE